jgi:hypothetical protein
MSPPSKAVGMSSRSSGLHRIETPNPCETRMSGSSSLPGGSLFLAGYRFDDLSRCDNGVRVIRQVDV